MNIRKRPLKINWTYALGEIIIVIIGITIAFALNNWAENAKERKTKRQYLESLLVDLGSEMTHLEKNIVRFEQKHESIIQVMPYLYGKKEGLDTAATNKVFQLAEIVYFKPQDITYKTLINSGELGLFEDFELKKALENHYASHEAIRLNYERQNKINEKYFGDFMIYKLDYNQLRKGDLSFMEDPLLRNIVQALYGSYNIAIDSSRKGIERCKQIRSLLEEQLNKL